MTPDAEGLSEEGILRLAKKTIRDEALAVRSVDNQIGSSFLRTVEIIRGAKGKVLVTGSGTTSHVARRMAHLLAVSGTPAMFIHSMDALHGTVGAVQSGDVLIAFSKTGESEEVVRLCTLSRDRGAKAIGVGESADSSLARACDEFVLLSTSDGGDPEGTIAMGSTLVMAVWGDALTRVLMYVHGWTLQESLAIHPAGGVGRRAREQSGAEPPVRFEPGEERATQ